eukprot:3378330-Rhodomonas_salina.2
MSVISSLSHLNARADSCDPLAYLTTASSSTESHLPMVVVPSRVTTGTSTYGSGSCALLSTGAYGASLAVVGGWTRRSACAAYDTEPYTNTTPPRSRSGGRPFSRGPSLALYPKMTCMTCGDCHTQRAPAPSMAARLSLFSNEARYLEHVDSSAGCGTDPQLKSKSSDLEPGREPYTLPSFVRTGLQVLVVGRFPNVIVMPEPSPSSQAHVRFCGLSGTMRGIRSMKTSECFEKGMLVIPATWTWTGNALHPATPKELSSDVNDDSGRKRKLPLERNLWYRPSEVFSLDEDCALLTDLSFRRAEIRSAHRSDDRAGVRKGRFEKCLLVPNGHPRREIAPIACGNYAPQLVVFQEEVSAPNAQRVAQHLTFYTSVRDFIGSSIPQVARNGDAYVVSKCSEVCPLDCQRPAPLGAAIRS